MERQFAAPYTSVKYHFSYIPINALLHPEVPCKILEEFKRRDARLGKFLFFKSLLDNRTVNN